MITPDIPLVLGAHVPALAAIYLFGSQARGDARADSDLDLAILADQPVSPEALAAARDAMEAAVGRDVDLIDLARASTVLVRQVLIDGRRLAAPNPLTADLFEVRSFRDYEDLKRRREGIEADIVCRGSVLAA
jgi:predicted nucleotidyltransferase